MKPNTTTPTPTNNISYCVEVESYTKDAEDEVQDKPSRLDEVDEDSCDLEDKVEEDTDGVLELVRHGGLLGGMGEGHIHHMFFKSILAHSVLLLESLEKKDVLEMGMDVVE